MSNLAEAAEWLQAERRLIREEHRSFREFETRVERIGPEQSPPIPTGAGRMLSTGTTGEPTHLARVRAAYRETVMAVSHYDEEYGDSLVESLTAEFGPDLTTALVHGSQLTVPIYGQLMQAISQSIQNRLSGREFVDTEQETLTEIHTELEDVHEEFDALAVCPSKEWTTDALKLGWGQLRDLHRRCDALASDRQQVLREHVTQYSRFTGREGFEGYMYPTVSTNHPGLAAIAVLAERIHATEKAFYDELQYRNDALEFRDDSIPGSPLATEYIDAHKTRS